VGLSLHQTDSYPDDDRGRDRWILSHRAARNAVDPRRPYAFFVEDERSTSGEAVPVATIFLTNRECPWRCLMCDLWRNTLTQTVPAGSIPEQVDYALSQLPAARQVKLYNSGSFFDRGAIPVEDYRPTAERLHRFERVVVESHPALVGDACLRFRDMLSGSLEVAMGLETAHPQVLARLNKRMTLEQFAHAAEFLRRNGIAVRAFVLVKPPFLDEAEALHWAQRSVDFAFDCGADVVACIPTRFGNGAMEALAEQGQFSPPRLATLQSAAAYGVRLKRGRVFMDLWDLERFSTCEQCFARRFAWLSEMNLSQEVPPAVSCPTCGTVQ
jgi:radical SAM enzyme (TIGR01210 family)